MTNRPRTGAAPPGDVTCKSALINIIRIELLNRPRARFRVDDASTTLSVSVDERRRGRASASMSVDEPLRRAASSSGSVGEDVRRRRPASGSPSRRRR